MTEKVYKALTKVALKLHNLSYKFATGLAIKAEGGFHPKHRLTDYHRFFVDNVAKGDAVFDIGCGNGALTYDLAKKAGCVVGIDIDEEGIGSARKRYSAPNIKYIVGDATKYRFKEKFDVVVLSNVLEHIENRVEFLEKIKKLAPRILIRVPMVDRDWITLYKKEQGVEWRLDPTHRTEYTLESFQEELQRVGLRLGKYSVQFGEIWAVVK